MKDATIRKMLKSETLYVRRTDSHVEMSNGHWLVRIAPAYLDCPEYSGYVPPLGEGRGSRNGLPVGTCPSFDTIWPKEKPAGKIERTRHLFELDSKAKTLARKMNGGDITTWLNREYVALVEELNAHYSPGAWYAEDATKPASYWIGDDCTAVVMPVNVKE